MPVVGDDKLVPSDAAEGLARLLFSNETRDSTLDAIARLAQGALPGCIAASVTVLDRGRPYTAVSSADLARVVDEQQYDTRQGPCLDAVRQQSQIVVQAYAAEQRWPDLTPRAIEAGVTSSLSMPLMVGDEALGALNMYAGVEGGLADHVDTAETFARTAAITLANAMAYLRAAELSTQLVEAVESRDVIGQAKGILMAREGIISDQAFDRLRQRSQHSNRKLHDIAVEMVEDHERNGVAGR